MRVGIVTDCKYVRRELSDFPLFVELYLVAGVDREDLVWIHCNQDGTGVCLKRRWRVVIVHFDM